MENETSPQTWPDLAIALFDRLAVRNSEIIYELENLDVTIPGETGGEADRKKWTVNGIMKLRIREHGE